ncbi:LD-carboxypeptidase [Photobacterium chitinilyticum]|uniref:LD-carboxypeptidase N-terminal domain-containing protein n=1 Tax=Photobacterium chitinilyticum TaxID=2485123 RepID=A0A444JS51_9GAMM|nr:LD-carboxypeptidase [Photobacterium chitinilyticum]RWX55941.1 hypothetical protein EDI28_06465 [Photobacterium chitinilyticum]
MSFLLNEDIDALTKVKPKWILGFSDVSTITAVLSSKLGWATAHCSNLMDLTSNAQYRRGSISDTAAGDTHPLDSGDYFM